MAAAALGAAAPVPLHVLSAGAAPGPSGFGPPRSRHGSAAQVGGAAGVQPALSAWGLPVLPPAGGPHLQGPPAPHPKIQGAGITPPEGGAGPPPPLPGSGRGAEPCFVQVMGAGGSCPQPKGRGLC